MLLDWGLLRVHLELRRDKGRAVVAVTVGVVGRTWYLLSVLLSVTSPGDPRSSKAVRKRNGSAS